MTKTSCIRGEEIYWMAGFHVSMGLPEVGLLLNSGLKHPK